MSFKPVLIWAEELVITGGTSWLTIDTPAGERLCTLRGRETLAAFGELRLHVRGPVPVGDQVVEIAESVNWNFLLASFNGGSSYKISHSTFKDILSWCSRKTRFRDHLTERLLTWDGTRFVCADGLVATVEPDEYAGLLAFFDSCLKGCDNAIFELRCGVRMKFCRESGGYFDRIRFIGADRTEYAALSKCSVSAIAAAIAASIARRHEKEVGRCTLSGQS